jgi:hypothetical protein
LIFLPRNARIDTPKQNNRKETPMARNSKAINVKIATTKVIKALESALDKLNKDFASQEANEAKHDKAVKAWNKEIGKLALAQISKAEDLSAHTRYNGEIQVSFSLPKNAIELPAEPKKDYVSIHEWQYRENKEEIENAIRILKMTDEELVSTSTYNAIARYL